MIDSEIDGLGLLWMKCGVIIGMNSVLLGVRVNFWLLFIRLLC